MKKSNEKFIVKLSEPQNILSVIYMFRLALK